MAAKTITTKAILDMEDRSAAGLAKAAQNWRGFEKQLDSVTRTMSAFSRAERSAADAARFSADVGRRMAEVQRSTGGGFWQRTEATRAGVSAFAGSASIIAAQKSVDLVKDMGARIKETFAIFDDRSRYQKSILGISDQQQKPLLKQAIEMGASTRYNDLQVLEAQLSLAQRGVKLEFIEPITKFAAEFGQAMNVELPEAAQALESALFSTGQNMETAAEALRNGQRVTDLMVKTAKIGGLNADDVQQLYKFGGAAGHAAGLSLETMGAMGAMMSRGGIRGDEAGVAIRSISGSLVSPTKKALMAMGALGVDFNKYVRTPHALSYENLQRATRVGLGVDLDDSQRSRINELLSNSDLIGSRDEFTKEVGGVLAEYFGSKNKKGGVTAKDRESIAKLVGSFWKASIESVDTERLLRDIIAANPSAAQANEIFTKQQGGRFQVMAQQGLPRFLEFFDTLKHTPQGFAASIGAERMGGYAGALTRSEGASKNLETALGRDFEAFMTPLYNAEAKLTQGFVEANGGLRHFVEAATLSVAAIVAFEGALKAAAIMQNISGNAAGAVAIAGLGGGAMARVGFLAKAAPWAYGLFEAGKGAVDSYQNMKGAGTGSPDSGLWYDRLNAWTGGRLENGLDKVDQWLGLSQGQGQGTGTIGRGAPGLPAFAGGGLEMKGAADVNVKVTVATDGDSMVKKIEQVLRATGNMQNPNGVTMRPLW